jgi:hypothetical protein
VPPGHGTYRGLDLERVDPDDENERTALLEAQHLEMEEALEAHEEIVTETGERQAVQRPAGLGYDWRNVMHMIMSPASSFLYQAMTAKQPFDREVYRRRLDELPGDWPPPQEIDLG